MTEINPNRKKSLDHISIILHRPIFPENIGACARAMMNMGLTDLRIVEPVDFDKRRAYKMATHVAAEIVDHAAVFTSLKEALKPYTFIAAASAREGGLRKTAFTPDNAAKKIIRSSESGRAAVIFGPEDKGLKNEELLFCDLIINIKTFGFSSLNLSQAVMIMCYELFNSAGISLKKEHPKSLATQHEKEGMLEQLESVLDKIHFKMIEKPEYWINRFRSFFSGREIQSDEVKLIRGFLKKVIRYGNKKSS
jgi:tRNA/rRNA methyltransferase